MLHVCSIKLHKFFYKSELLKVYWFRIILTIQIYFKYKINVLKSLICYDLNIYLYIKSE